MIVARLQQPHHGRAAANLAENQTRSHFVGFRKARMSPPAPICSTFIVRLNLIHFLLEQGLTTPIIAGV
jgi:hypothetical protein